MELALHSHFPSSLLHFDPELLNKLGYSLGTFLFFLIFDAFNTLVPMTGVYELYIHVLVIPVPRNSSP